MLRRFSALIVAVLVAAAPSALTACELMCAQHEAMASEAPAHSCHDTQADEGEGPVIAAAPHTCGHIAALPSASGEFSPTSIVAVPAATTWLFGPFGISRGTSHVTHAPPHPADRSTYLIPLRI